jgi:Mrp family chromosome partitioning ATPase
MTIEQQVIDALDAVTVPGSMRSLKKMNMLSYMARDGSKMHLDIASTGLSEESQDWIRSRVIDECLKLEGLTEVDVDFVPVKASELNNVKHIVAIMSGKGGVGKSLVTSLTAIALRRRGLEVGILDADITGPSIPHMFGITGSPFGSETGMFPVSSKTGIQVMSLNLLLPSEDDAVIWRGPMIGGTIKQFWEEVLWGDLDYLIVDLPPGTADAPLTVLQSLPVSGVLVVFTPQDLTAMVVRKAVKMTQKMNVPVVGVVENMSYLYVPEIKKKIEIFGKSRAEDMARAADAPLIGQIPIDPSLAALCDEGDIELYNNEIMDKLADSLANLKESCGCGGGSCCGSEGGGGCGSGCSEGGSSCGEGGSCCGHQ